jgi:hypothetical protein
MTDFKIDKGVPLPPTKHGTKKYPFGEMEVGDSVFFAGNTSDKISSAYAYYQRNGKRFANRTVIENGLSGVRVWRVE